jgi:uncharacterized membrane protein
MTLEQEEIRSVDEAFGLAQAGLPTPEQNLADIGTAARMYVAKQEWTNGTFGDEAATSFVAIAIFGWIIVKIAIAGISAVFLGALLFLFVVLPVLILTSPIWLLVWLVWLVRKIKRAASSERTGDSALTP